MDYTVRATKLKAMSHPVRLEILDMLRQGEICVCHIEKALGKRQAYISQQLMALRKAGLVDSRKAGLQVHYCIADAQSLDLLDVLCGEADHEFDILPDCTCPHCSTVLITDVR